MGSLFVALIYIWTKQNKFKQTTNCYAKEYTDSAMRNTNCI